MADPQLIEYKVRKVERFIVTRYEKTEGGGSVGEVGQYSDFDRAYDVAYACCYVEHQRLGWPLDDPRIQYPKTPTGSILPPEMHEVQMDIDANRNAGDS